MKHLPRASTSTAKFYFFTNETLLTVDYISTTCPKLVSGFSN
jgi:hypothetical protein